MFARSFTIEGQPESVDTGIAHCRDVVVPAMDELEGCVGLSLLVDRQSGRCIATSSWESVREMRASAERVAIIRDHIALMFDGNASVQEWSVAFLNRRQPSLEGAAVRATWVKIVPDQLERSLDFYQLVVVPEMEDLEGFCNASLLVDHPTSRRAVLCTTFDSPETMARNSDVASELRSRRARDLGAEIVDVAEFELAIANVKVADLV
jgi:quinol monooxygenase YgiN